MSAHCLPRCVAVSESLVHKGGNHFPPFHFRSLCPYSGLPALGLATPSLPALLWSAPPTQLPEQCFTNIAFIPPTLIEQPAVLVK